MKPKTIKIIFWVATLMIVLFEGVMPALTSQSELAKEGIRHLGYPEYFGMMLTVFKVLGAIALLFNKVPGRIKEWAYAGFAFDFISAFVSIWVVDGFMLMTLLPLFALAILAVSYVFYHKKNNLV